MIEEHESLGSEIQNYGIEMKSIETINDIKRKFLEMAREHKKDFVTFYNIIMRNIDDGKTNKLTVAQIIDEIKVDAIKLTLISVSTEAQSTF